MEAGHCRVYGTIQQHDDGTAASPASHKPPLKGEDPGLPETTQENYRIGEHATSKELKNGGKFDPREPKPKGPAAIDLDSDYSKPTGPSTTRQPLKKN